MKNEDYVLRYLQLKNVTYEGGHPSHCKLFSVLVLREAKHRLVMNLGFYANNPSF